MEDMPRTARPSSDRILGAAEKVFARQGYGETSLRQLMAAARVSTTAFYARFDSKEAVLVALVDRLIATSPEFDAWWPEHDVARFETRLRRFNHPTAGLLTFEYQLLSPAEWPSLTVAVQLPVPGDDSAQRLAVRHHVA